MDRFRVDSHKMIYHVERVHDWLKGKLVWPLYLEIAPCGGCNHRCIFCAVDYLKYKPHFLRKDLFLKVLRIAGTSGVRSIMYAGEGEPLLHPAITEIVAFTKKCGIDVSMTSNGVLLTEALREPLLKDLSWLRVSLNAGRPETYARVHRTGLQDFPRVLENLRRAVELKRRKKFHVTIGVQMLLIPENKREVFELAKILKKIGVDYLSIKPYSQHPLSGSRIDPEFRYGSFMKMEKRLRGIETEAFKVIFRLETMRRLDAGRDYEHCYGLPFWAYIDACGDVYACSAFLGKKEFCFGNIYRTSFGSIMKSARRRQIIKKAADRLDTHECRQVCRMDKINSYLWELKHPGPHVNFI